MGSKSLEQLRFYHLIHHTMAYSRRVVKYQQRRHASYVLEDVQQSLTDTFCRFTSEYLGKSVITVRKGYRQIFFPRTDLIHLEVCLSEIYLAAAGFPYKLLRSSGLDFFPDSLDILLNGVVASDKAFFISETLENSLCRVTLLIPVLGVLLQVTADFLFVWGDNG